MEETATTHETLELSDNLLKEIFALSTASTDYEVELAYDPKNSDFWQNENLDESYKLNQQKKEYSLDALRGVLGWLNRHGFRVTQEGKEVDLNPVLELLVQKSDESE